MQVHQMISAHPDVSGSTNDVLIRAIEQILECAEVCQVCADACLAEDMVAELRQCIRTDLDCADICAVTARLAARRTGSNEALIVEALRLCERACALCAHECEKHADMHQHCRICAATCRACEAACRDAAHSITAQ